MARALVGTEGTCVAVLEADIGLVKNPPKRALLVLAAVGLIAGTVLVGSRR
ncbi:MAG: hypothetical protein KGJ78_00825 [Alphaproteobacteria bacterium]|nr:hypothetical protein [Alphaproteobacteria bacterium]